MKRNHILIILAAAIPILLLTGVMAWVATDYQSFQKELPAKEALAGQAGDSKEVQDDGGLKGEGSEGDKTKGNETDGNGSGSANSDPSESSLSATSNDKTQASSEGAGESPYPIRLAFTGDLLLSDYVLEAYKNGGITGILEQELLDIGKDADIFMGNEEFPFSQRGVAAEDKQFTFRLPPDKVHIFQEMGLDIVSLANNHTLDFGTDALLDTLDTLDQAGIARVGAGRNLEEARRLKTMEVRGVTIGFLAASRVIPVYDWNATANTPGLFTTYDPTLLLEDIEAAKGVCDYLVVFVHWGEEKNNSPLAYQHTMGAQYIDAGADLVVGCHPHVLQGIEYYNGKPIVHSLGNYLFGSSIPKTALLQVELTEEGASLSLVPCTSYNGYTQRITDPQKKKDFYEWMGELSFSAAIDSETGQVSPKAASAN